MSISYTDGLHALLGLDAGGPQPQAFLAAELRGEFEGFKESFTVDEAAIQLTRSDVSWGPPGVTVTYAFRPRPPVDMPGDTSGFSYFNPTQMAYAHLALQAWADVARITFVQNNPGGFTTEAAILFANFEYGEDASAAFAFFPGHQGGFFPDGDVWINIDVATNATPAAFNFGGFALVHEIGHALGLDHPGDYNAGEGEFSYASTAEYAEDSYQYTVMSYFSEANTGANFGGLFPAAPMLDDIAAAQLLYGANMSTRTGDTTYGFNSNAGRPWFQATTTQKVVFAAWDAGGTDTFDFSLYSSNGVIDLRPGHFSSVGGLTGNVAVALGTNIERAIAGSGSDQVFGNDLANWLRGGAGDDQLSGFAGFDDMHGNTGADTLWAGGDGDWVVGGQDGDLLLGEAGGDIIYGNLGADSALGGDGNDTLTAGQGDDVVQGDNGDDWLGGDRGADTVSGGAGADTFRFFTGAGLDKVLDFNGAEGDRILLEGGGTYTVSQAGADLVIDLGAGDQIILVNVSEASFQASWIVT